MRDKLVIVIANEYEGSFLRRISTLSGVLAVKESRLYSLRGSLLPMRKDLLVLLVDMGLRYPNVQAYLQEHRMQIIELHRGKHYRGLENEMGMLVCFPYRNEDELLRLIETLS